MVKLLVGNGVVLSTCTSAGVSERFPRIFFVCCLPSRLAHARSMSFQAFAKVAAWQAKAKYVTALSPIFVQHS